MVTSALRGLPSVVRRRRHRLRGRRRLVPPLLPALRRGGGHFDVAILLPDCDGRRRPRARGGETCARKRSGGARLDGVEELLGDECRRRHGLSVFETQLSNESPLLGGRAPSSATPCAMAPFKAQGANQALPTLSLSRRSTTTPPATPPPTLPRRQPPTPPTQRACADAAAVVHWRSPASHEAEATARAVKVRLAACVALCTRPPRSRPPTGMRRGRSRRRARRTRKRSC